jgi:hypothetical protein
LTSHFAVAGWLTLPALERRLWLVEQAGDYATTRFRHIRDGTKRPVAKDTCKILADRAKTQLRCDAGVIGGQKCPSRSR